MIAINIYVDNLPYTSTDAELESLFSQFGAVRKASIITDRDTGRSRGFGFIEMVNEQKGREAIEQLQSQPFEGRPLTVNEARSRAGGVGGGGYGGYSRER